MIWLLLLLLFPAVALCHYGWESKSSKRKMRKLNNTMNNLEMYNARFTFPQDAGDAEDS